MPVKNLAAPLLVSLKPRARRLLYSSVDVLGLYPFSKLHNVYRVFTPPEIADAILDLIAEAWAAAHDGAVIWENKDVTFLDPFTKSGVFLRQIVARLTDGLALQIPELKSRVDHILTRQVFGLGITSLTSLLARRSVYCSKFANSSFSIASSFSSESGNIWFERTEHSWVGGEKLLGIDQSAVYRATTGGKRARGFR